MGYRMKDHMAWNRGLEIDKQEGSFNESKSVVNASKMNPRMQKKQKKQNKGDTRNTGKNIGKTQGEHGTGEKIWNRGDNPTKSEGKTQTWKHKGW